MLLNWLLASRLRASAFPLGSSFVCHNEFAETFVEIVSAPWFVRGHRRAGNHSTVYVVVTCARYQRQERCVVWELIGV
ncbi:hypothetical protein [Mycobacterium leprae]|uniref:hypothetical protein n=1 Tax=Mycobacterium leprae TaxID=1769 RepID=UPI0012E82011|nr:hypothetical protein [Mycobacterium leprae]